MAADASAQGLTRVLGGEAAEALQSWAHTHSRTVRLANPEWKSSGYTGARLAAINVSTIGEPDVKIILKVCPSGPYALEPAAHKQAKAHSRPEFFSQHLVEQLYPEHPVEGGGRLMFQEIAGATLDVVSLSRVPDENLVDCCEVVIRSVLTQWNPTIVRSSEQTVGEFLRKELRDALETGGSLHGLASSMRLLEPDNAWIQDASRDAQALPNPVLMASDPALGAAIKFDVICGPAHGDLHLENILIPNEYGQLEPERFRLVDLSTFDAQAPITRDPVTLMLSVIAPTVSELRPDEQEALLNFVLEPWMPSPPRLSSLVVNALERIYRTGNEATKLMHLGDWRSQFLLSVQARALLFTTFEDVGEPGRWWFLRLAARAGAAFLRRHGPVRSGALFELRRPVSMGPARRTVGGDPGVRPLEAPVGSGREILLSAERAELVRLMGESGLARVKDAYHTTVDGAAKTRQPDWADASSVVRAVEASRGSPLAPQVFVFADRLAHVSQASMRLKLHHWLNGVAHRHGVSEDSLRRLCAQSDQRGSGANASKAGGTLPKAEQKEAAQTTVVENDSLLRPPGGPMSSKTALPTGAEGRVQTPQRRKIVGNLPSKNPAFKGRSQLLGAMYTKLQELSSVSVIPQALHGLGGVGKTQLAIEFVHRNLDRYDVVWWISAEDPVRVRASLGELAKAIEVPTGQEARQTVSLVLEALSTSPYRWLLVYDNVDRRGDIDGLTPPTGTGNVIITSRNTAEWAASPEAIEVDVFDRPESIELLQHHGRTISHDEANLLADKLGDLPLALEQAAIWHASTGMPVAEYLEEFERNVSELLQEGRPPDYSDTIYGILKVALDRLRAESSASTEFLELFAFLGPEPISVELLRRGRDAGLSPELSRALKRTIETNRTIRDLRRYALAKVETEGQKIQVHRLVQRVLLEELEPDRLAQAKTNVQRLLASANPSYPDEPNTWPVHAEIGSHILAADLINAPEYLARLVVVDQVRYLFQRGDFEASMKLGERALNAWQHSNDPALGPDLELELIAGRHLANTLRMMGHSRRARELNKVTFERLCASPEFGEDHEHTLYTANGLGVDLRIEGKFTEALAIEEANVERHKRVFPDDEDDSTWRAQNNLAASLRHLGQFQRAYEIDSRIADHYHRRLAANDPRRLNAEQNLALDLYGLGDYRAALEKQRKVAGPLSEELPAHHRWVLLGAKTMTVVLRKCGYFADSRDRGRENYHDFEASFGSKHEFTLAASISYSNALRCCGEAAAARTEMRETVDLYKEVFGQEHPFTFAAMVDLAIILRATGDHQESSAMDAKAFQGLTEALGLEHPYTLAAANGVANGLARSGKFAEARELSAQTHEIARGVRGEEHPETLAYAINAAFDEQATGGSGANLDQILAKLREALGADHPDAIDAGRGVRAECDIELPPT